MEEWRTYKYTDLCSLIGGGTPKTSESSYWGGDIPWLSVKDFGTGGKYVYSTEKHITEKGLNNSSTKLLQRDDIIISARGTIGAMAMIPFPMAFNQSCFGIRANNKVDPHFLFYLTKTKIAELQTNSHGSVFDTITRDTFDKIECYIPDISTQRRIATILSNLDDKILLNNRINHNLEEQAQALYKSWFVDFEPFKDGKFVYSELGLIPEGWRIGKISDIATVTSGKRPNVKYESSSAEHSIPVFGASSVMAFTDSVYLKERAIITGRVGTLGILQRVDFPCWPSDNTLIIQSPYENFVYQELGEVDYSSLNRGSTQPLLTQSDLKSWSIIIPPKEIIAEYESLIRDNTDLIAEHCVQNQRLSLLRDTLLPQLMSGQLTC